VVVLNNRTQEITRKLYVLVLASTADAFFTYTGVAAGRIEEANPLMKNVVHNPHLLFGIKVLLPLTAVFIILRFTKKGSRHLSKFTILLVNAAVFIYAAVLFLHVYCLFITS